MQRAKLALTRHADVEKISQSFDTSDIADMRQKLDTRITAINEGFNITKAKIQDIVSQAYDTRMKLRAMKHVANAESSDLRDKFCLLTYDALQEDVHLAWQRKEQLQMVELLAMLRPASAPTDTL